MDNLTAKEILSAYRPNGADAQDKNFSEALTQCRHDPTLHDWFVEEQRFDADASASLAALTVPRTGKERLLQNPNPAFNGGSSSLPGKSGGKAATVFPWFKRSIGWGIAALFLLGFALWHTLVPRSAPVPFEASTFSVERLLSEALPLSYRSDDPADSIAWLANRGAPVPERLPDGLADAAALGCRVFKVTGAGEISLICLLLNSEVVHFFVFNEEASALLTDAPLDTWWEEADWSVYSFVQGDQRIVLATQGSTNIL